MNKEEAFRQWINSTQGKGLTYQEMWNAACAWQCNNDIKVCMDQIDWEWPADEVSLQAVKCAEAIRDQS